MTALFDFVIPPMSAHAVLLDKGQILRVTDVEGAQVADLVAFTRSEPREAFAQNFTRMNNSKVSVGVGDVLYSNQNTPMFRIVKDTVGVHDMLFAPCNEFFYRHAFAIEGKTGCRDHLADALKEFGVEHHCITDPFNVFMHTCIDSLTGEMKILSPVSGPGDYLELQAETDLVVGVSSCAADITACNGGHCTSIRLRVSI